MGSNNLDIFEMGPDLIPFWTHWSNAPVIKLRFEHKNGFFTAHRPPGLDSPPSRRDHRRERLKPAYPTLKRGRASLCTCQRALALSASTGPRTLHFARSA